MNKYQEALDKLLMWSSNGYCALEVESEEYTYLKETLQELVEKSKPKKLIKTTLYEDDHHAVIAYKCPNCCKVYTAILDKYCSECGQKFEEWM